MTTPDHVQLEVLGRLDPDETAAVALLVERATEADGVRPLSEHVSLHLRHGGDDRARNLLLWVPEPGNRPQLAGYAHLDVTDAVAGPSAELVVDPAWRGVGVGGTLLRGVRAEAPGGRLRLWAHGEHPAAARLAASTGLGRARTLLQLRRSLYAPLPEPRLPDGVTVRAFRPGRDDQAWLDLNARAFDGHPEQARWTAADLRVRLAEPWFDAAGFFLAVRGDRLVGFHWTKVHGGHHEHGHDDHDGHDHGHADHGHPDHGHGHGHGHADHGHGHGHADHGHPDHGHAEHGHAEHGHGHAEHGHEPIGEVYVVGVDPAEQGQGLGRALTLVGLRHLRSLGLQAAMLYVEADNAAAIAVYERLGFTRWDTDVMYAAPTPTPIPPQGTPHPAL